MYSNEMREKVLKLEKKEGETPLECLDRFRISSPEYTDAILSYVGRLDPMAEGLLLVIVDEENKNREKYLVMDKKYEVDVLFGIKTDTGDVLGRINPPQPSFLKEGDSSLDKGRLGGILNKFIGQVTLPYPQYSSKPVNGKPLFQWSREGKIKEIEIPVKTSKIYDIKSTDEYSLNSKEILKQVIYRINQVKGDFRQEEIIKSWNGSLGELNQEFYFVKIDVTCSSGTYMRSLAEYIADSMGTVGIAWKIKRTWVGFHT